MKQLKKIIFIISILVIACNKKEKNIFDFTVNINKSNAKYQLGDSLRISIKNDKTYKIDKIVYDFQQESFTKTDISPLEISLKDHLLGKHTIKVTVFSNGSKFSSTKNIVILNDLPPTVYNYEIVNTYPHNTEHFTQGLEFKDDELFESAGRYNQSKLLKIDLKTGSILKTHILDKKYFAEGLTIVNGKILQLTLEEDIGFIYDLESFKQERTFNYDQSKQGWGICYDQKKTIYKSDGTSQIWKLNSKTLKEEGFIQIATNRSIKSQFNELEWVNGKIYANTWHKDGVAIINPRNGAIEGIINCKGLRKKAGVTISDKNKEKVLNGIAYKRNENKLFVTGKYWNKIFEIKVLK